MLTRLFNNLRIQSLVFALFFAAICVGSAVYINDISDVNLHIGEALWSIPADFYKFILGILILVYALMVNSIFLRSSFLKKHFFGLSLFGIITFSLTFHHADVALLVVAPILLWWFWRILQIVFEADVINAVFDIGLLIGVCLLFSPQSIFLLPISWAVFLLLGHLSLRTLLIPLVGIITIYFLVFSAYFFFSDFNFATHVLHQFQSLSFSFSPFNSIRFALIPIGLALIPAFGEYVKAGSAAKVGKRKMLNITAVIFVLALTASFFLENASTYMFVVAISTTALLANLLQYIEKWWWQDFVYIATLISLFATATS